MCVKEILYRFSTLGYYGNFLFVSILLWTSCTFIQWDKLYGKSSLCFVYQTIRSWLWLAKDLCVFHWFHCCIETLAMEVCLAAGDGCWAALHSENITWVMVKMTLYESCYVLLMFLVSAMFLNFSDCVPFNQ